MILDSEGFVVKSGIKKLDRRVWKCIRELHHEGSVIELCITKNSKSIVNGIAFFVDGGKSDLSLKLTTEDKDLYGKQFLLAVDLFKDTYSHWAFNTVLQL